MKVFWNDAIGDASLLFTSFGCDLLLLIYRTSGGSGIYLLKNFSNQFMFGLLWIDVMYRFKLGHVCCVIANAMVLLSPVTVTSNCWTLSQGYSWSEYPYLVPFSWRIVVIDIYQHFTINSIYFGLFIRLLTWNLYEWSPLDTLFSHEWQARKTIIIVCEVLRNCKDSSVEPVVSKFHSKYSISFI